MLDLSLKHEIKDIEYWSSDINQLYHPTSIYKQDSQSFIYAKDNLNITKFTPILLKEWFYLIEKGGYLIIDYVANNSYNWKCLEKDMWWLWKNNYEIVYHNCINTKLDSKESIESFIDTIKNCSSDNITPKDTHKDYLRFVCKKLNNTLIPNDSINKWTFGIISNGKRDNYITRIIESIMIQNILDFEIIVCGTYNGSLNNVKYIPFNKRDKLGWISKKKNIIVNASKYENICMLHDRLVLNNNWYENINEWGNCFDHLGCSQIYNNIRSNDYLIHESVENKPFGFASLMDYRDWDKDVFNAGQLHISKKQFLQRYPWNESLVWGNPEDLEISKDLMRNGYILRMNPTVIFQVQTSRFIDELPQVVFNVEKLSNKREGKFIRILGRKIYKYISKFRLLSSLVVHIGNKIYHKGT